jgi:hypothetical protein
LSFAYCMMNKAVASYLYCLRARGSGDRAIDSGSIGRGFESLRAHALLSFACLGLNFNL